MITGIIVAAVVVGCVGIILGFFLGIAGEKFKVETDPREDAILEVLPGNNCGGCGYAGCSGLAAAIAKGEAPVNQCPVGGEPVATPVRKQNRITSIPEWKIVRQWHLFQMADQSPAIMDVWDLEIV